MASTDATAIPVKNQAYRITFPIWDADGDLVTGATGLDSEVSKDGGTFADCTSEATEIATSSGMYYLDLTSTEMNADTVAIIVKTSSSGAKTTVLVLYPQEGADIKVSVTHWTGTAVATPDTAGYPKVTVKSGTGTGEISLTSGVAAVNVTQFGGTNGTFASGRPEVNTTHAAGTAWNSGGITSSTFAASSIAAAAIATGAITSAKFAAGAITATVIATDAIDADALAADAVTEIQSGLSTLNAAGVRSAVGLASANLDTQLSAIDDYIDTEINQISSNLSSLITLVGTPTDESLANDIAAVATALGSPMQAGTKVVLHATQTDYAPAKAGDAMALTSGERTTLSGVVWNSLTSGFATVGSIGKLLKDNVDAAISSITGGGGGGGDATLANQTAILAAVADVQTAVDALSVGAGSGAYTVVVTVDDGTTALQNATVRLTEGANSFTAVTDASGEATFNLDAATYTVAITKDGYSFAGDTHAVTSASGTHAVTFSMDEISATPATDPGQCNCRVKVVDYKGDAVNAASLTFTLQDGPGTAGFAISTASRTETSGSDGYATITLRRGDVWSYGLTNAPDRKTFTVPAAATYDLPEVTAATNPQ